MSSQDRDESGVSFAPPAEVADWLAGEAADRGEARDDVCRRLVTAAHAVATDDDLEPVGRDELTALQGQFEAQHEEFTALLEDVRSRVVQVKRETDGKASADHTHPDSLTEDDLESIRAELATLEDTVESGFDNFETVLENLLDETDDLAERSTLLARAVIDLRERRDAVADRERRRAGAEELQLAANRLGVRTASCTDCESSVDIALLTAPECPHCASQFTDVSEKSSIFGSHRLRTGDPPALEGRVEAPTEPSPAELFEGVDDATDHPDFDRDDSTRPIDSEGTER